MKNCSGGTKIVAIIYEIPRSAAALIATTKQPALKHENKKKANSPFPDLLPLEATRAENSNFA